MTESTRIRGRRLQAIRRRHFMHEPLCVMCKAKGKTTPAVELDHIIALTNGGEDTDENRQGLCTPCHAAKTREDMGYAERTQFDARGRVVW